MKNIITGMVISFLMGMLAMQLIIEQIDKRLPEAFTIEKNGKVIGFANTDSYFTEYVYIKDAKSPGMFVAFPIYGEKDYNAA